MLNREALETELRHFWKDEKMVAHCMKSTKYIELDNWFLDVCNAKPTIDATMYYNDEYAAPETNKEGFINYNRHNMPELLTDENRHFLAGKYWKQNGERLAGIISCRRWDEPHSSCEVMRELTPAEIETINAAIEEVRADYQKRLETYFKRYSGKISTHGYWANR